jgi:outer membrane protein TolC
MMWLLIGAAWALTPEEAVRSALSHAPDVAAAEGRVDAARGALAASRGLSANPTLNGRVGPERLELELTQAVSLTGAGRTAAGAARAEVEAAEAALTRARLVAAAETRRAYVRASAAETRSTLADRERETARRLREASEARVKAGAAAELEAQVARLGEARAMGAWIGAVDAAATARAALAALVAAPVDTLATDPMAAAPREVSAKPGARSDVLAAQATTEAARKALASQRAGALPPVLLGAFYERDGQDVVAGAAFSVAVPVWHRNEAGIGAARGELRAAESAETSLLARANEEQRGAARRLSVLDGALGNDLSADADAALAALEGAVTAGQLSPLEAANLRARVYEGQTGWIAARAAAAEARIDAALAVDSDGLLP